MYTNSPTSPYPQSYMANWYAGPNGKNIAQKENDWSQHNSSGTAIPKYDKLYESLDTETDMEQAAQTFIKMNDILIDNFVVLPLVNRASEKYAIANTLHSENVAVSDFETDYWNIANWNRTT